MVLFARRGAGSSQWRRSVPIAVAETRTPSRLQLAFDALVAPARVLPGQADNQLLHLRVQRWPAGRAVVREGPRASDQPPVPAQQRLRSNEEARPARPWQYAADRGEQRPIGGLQLGTWGLAAEDHELVAQDEDLQVLGGVTAGEQHEQLDGTAQHEVGELRQHQDGLPGRSSRVPPYRAVDANWQLIGHVRPCAPFTLGHMVPRRENQTSQELRNPCGAEIRTPRHGTRPCQP